MSHLIIGCGYLGSRVASQWLSQGKHVAALTRSKAEEFRSEGIDPILGDITRPESLKALPKAKTVLYAVGMDRSSGRSFREVYVDGLRNVLEHLPMPERFLYVSSTSVYGQTSGEDVDESSATEPLEENGKVILEAEATLRRYLPEAIILRFAGIYGPGRILRRRASIESGQPIICDPEKWLNLVHVEDGARAVLAAEQRGRVGETYLIADSAPMRRRDFYSFMAELLGAPAPTFQVDPLSAMENNRRIMNRKMLQELGVELTYPNYREGLRASI